VTDSISGSARASSKESASFGFSASSVALWIGQEVSASCSVPSGAVAGAVALLFVEAPIAASPLAGTQTEEVQIGSRQKQATPLTVLAQLPQLVVASCETFQGSKPTGAFATQPQRCSKEQGP